MTQKKTNQNILSSRYASEQINNLFSEESKILLEREFWIELMKLQKESGVNIPQEEITKFENAKNKIDLKEIRDIEKVTKHDVKAKIESFVNTACADEHIHKGLTSRDLTDNLEQIIIKKASEIILKKYISVLKKLLEKSKQYKQLIMVARTHNQPAQPTVLGKKFSMWAQELTFHIKDFERFVHTLPLRGIKGAVGTQVDMKSLVGCENKIKKIETSIANHFGFEQIMNSVGQVYPRSFDAALASKLAALGSCCANIAKSIRLMSGKELLSEGFSKGQVGSSAMPHKMNTRSCERICGFSKLLKMYSQGALSLAGDQWEEGDVSCSVVRRVIIPDMFYVSDGICTTTEHILNNLTVFKNKIKEELDKNLPFIASSKFLMEFVKAGIGREHAHELIKEVAVKEALRLRNYGGENKVIEQLANNKKIIRAGITKEELLQIINDKEQFLGSAQTQIKELNSQCREQFKEYFDEIKNNKESYEDIL
ncbi:adenylosuccinate lyase [Candidatus Woesearchaeota archaeon]|nr:adenylosuccinate lyase [Candidatus Woesearchaeota archaeon]